MMDRWDEKNPYEKLLREFMPKRMNDKKEEKAMTSQEEPQRDILLVR